MPSVSVYRYADRAVACPYHRVPSGPHYAGEQLVPIAWDDDDARLGAAVVHALAIAGRPLAAPPADAIGPTLDALGAGSYRALERDGRSVSVSVGEPGWDVLPMRNEGVGQGFAHGAVTARLTALEPKALGQAVRAAMELAGPDAPVAAAAPASTETGAPATAEGALVADLRKSAAWVAEGLQSSGYQVDWTVASLAELDRFFDDNTRKPGKPTRRGLLSEDVGAKLFGIGGYVGEVLAREAGWRWIDGTDEVDVAIVSPDGSQAWPVQRVMKRFELGPEESLAEYGRALAAKPWEGPR